MKLGRLVQQIQWFIVRWIFVLWTGTADQNIFKSFKSYLPQPVLIDFIQSICRTVTQNFLASFSLSDASSSLNNLRNILIRFGVGLCRLCLSAAIMQILDCIISRVGLHDLSFGFGNLDCTNWLECTLRINKPCKGLPKSLTGPPWEVTRSASPLCVVYWVYIGQWLALGWP